MRVLRDNSLLSLYTRRVDANAATIARIRAPDTASIKQKMVYASSKDVLKRALVGLSADIQGTDHSEIAYDTGAQRLVCLSSRNMELIASHLITPHSP